MVEIMIIAFCIIATFFSALHWWSIVREKMIRDNHMTSDGYIVREENRTFEKELRRDVEYIDPPTFIFTPLKKQETGDPAEGKAW